MCVVLKPIGYSSERAAIETAANELDTDETVRDIRTYNAKRQEYCK